MKVSLKQAIVAALAVGGALGAVAARADVTPPTSGNGELSLFVYNTATQASYARGTGIFLNDIVTEGVSGGSYSGPATVNFSIPTLSADQNLLDFLGTGPASNFVWGLQGGDTVGSNLATAPRRIAFSSTIDSATLAIPSNSTLTTTTGSMNTAFGTLNGNIPGTTLGDKSSVVGASTAGGLWGTSGGPGMNNLYSANIDNAASLGSAAHLYLVTSSSTGQTSGNALPGRLFSAVDITLDTLLGGNGALHAVATSAVPIPAAVWLFGSGLMGLVGIGRRRRNGEPTGAVA